MKCKPKVLHIINSHSYSGAENVIISIMENTKDDVDACYTSPDGSIRDILNQKGISYIPVHAKNLSPKNIKEVIDQYKPDIIHAHDFRAGIFSCMTMTSLPIINHLHNNSPWLRRYSFYTALYAICCCRFKQILTVSNSVMDEFVFGKIFKSKTRVIGNPFDANKIRALANTATLNGSSDLIFIGRLAPQKNVFFFLEVVKILTEHFPTIRVSIVGDGELRQAIVEKIHELHLDKNIKMYGFQKNPYGLLRNSSILCMPSKWEGFGLVAVEALALGIPVVCSGAGGLKGIVDSSCGKICGFAKDEYVNEIKKCLNHKTYYSAKVNNALKKADEFSNINRYIDEMRMIYHRVLQ